ncbi:Os03g0685700, partial [Oryza sativa Japonica Group]
NYSQEASLRRKTAATTAPRLEGALVAGEARAATSPAGVGHVLHRGHQRERHRRAVGAARAYQGSSGISTLSEVPRGAPQVARKKLCKSS